jgi:hypothetical protein
MCVSLADGRISLQRFLHYCMTPPQWWNQPRPSETVMVARTRAIVCSRASRVRTLAVREAVLSFDQHGSVGDNSGKYGSKYSTRAPVWSIASRMPVAL